MRIADALGPTPLFTQLMQCVRVDVCLARIEKNQDGLLTGHGSSIDQSVGTERLAWLSVAVTQGLRSKSLFSF